MQCIYVVCLGGIVGDIQFKNGSTKLYIVCIERKIMCENRKVCRFLLNI
jgi:hypothetical protein